MTRPTLLCALALLSLSAVAAADPPPRGAAPPVQQGPIIHIHGQRQAPWAFQLMQRTSPPNDHPELAHTPVSPVVDAVRRAPF